MDKYKIKDLAERLQKEKTTELKNKMLFMWIKQDVISLKEYNELVKLILYGVGSTFVLFADWLQYNGKWLLPEEQVKQFIKEHKQN